MKNTIAPQLKALIFEALGVKTLAAVKKRLKDAATNEYGNFSATIDTGRGVKLIYTDNSNCFASYIVRVQYPGLCSEYAFDRASITQAGRLRGISRTLF